VTPTFVWKALHGQALPVENGGVATRDFIYVGDMVAGLIACAERGEPGGVYNLASGVETSIRELAETVVELAGSGSVELAPARDWDRSGKRFGAVEKAARELGFCATVPLRDGLERTIAWTRSNDARIAACIERHAERMAAAAM
jgi:nucleoside-diphosphate-sugar epimerase